MARAWLIVAWLLLVPGLARADVPAEIPVQGLITEKDGTRIDGPLSMTFSMYDAPSATTPFWSETQTVVVSDGFFASQLGVSAPLDVARFADAGGVFVGVAIDGGAEIGRLRLASTAYAFHAESAVDAETLGGEGPEAFARSNARCPTGEVLNGIDADGGPICVVDRDTIFEGVFAMADRQCSIGAAVTGIAPDGELVCTDVGLDVSCEDGDVLTSDGVGWACGPGIDSYQELDPSFDASAAKGITAALIGQWNQAYGWGDHASAGYVESETDPSFNASAAKGITAALIGQWNQAYGWGDHASAGYVESEVDPDFAASPAKGITAASIAQWDDAYGWGDHASAGYLTVETDPEHPADGLSQYEIDRMRTRVAWALVLDLMPRSHVAPLCTTHAGTSFPLAVPPAWTDGASRTGSQWCALNTHPTQKVCKGVLAAGRLITGAFADIVSENPATCDTPIATPWPYGSFTPLPTTLTDGGGGAWPFSWVICCGT